MQVLSLLETAAAIVFAILATKAGCVKAAPMPEETRYTVPEALNCANCADYFVSNKYLPTWTAATARCATKAGGCACRPSKGVTTDCKCLNCN